MGTKTVPISSAEILAAQAESGQAGVEAYQQAQADLKRMQSSAVQQAQQEAASRGAPAGATAGLGAGVSRAYDERIASMRQGEASVSDSATSRQQRLADYNANVLAARSLIGDQTAQAVAPINAQSDYQIRALERQGANTVEQINAQFRLEMAKAEAAARAAMARASGGGRSGGGGGGGSDTTKAKKLTDNDLKAMLSRRGVDKVNEATALAQQLLAKDQTRFTNESDSAEKQWARDRNRIGLNQMSARRIAAAEAAKPRTVPSSSADRDVKPEYKRAEPDYVWGTGSILPLGWGGGMSTPNFVPSVPDETPPDSRTGIDRIGTPLSAGSIGKSPGGLTPALPQPQRPDPIPFRYVAPAQLGPKQFAELASSEFAPIYDAMLASGDPIRSSEELARLLVGPGRGGDPYEVEMAASALQQAMTMAAIQAVDSGEFAISQEELNNTLGWDESYSAGATAADVLGSQFGSTNAKAQNVEDWWTEYTRNHQIDQDEQQILDREIDDQLELAEQMQDANERDAIRTFTQATGIPVPTGVDAQDASNAWNSDRRDVILAALTAAGYDPSISGPVREFAILNDAADPFNSSLDEIILRIIETKYG